MLLQSLLDLLAACPTYWLFPGYPSSRPISHNYLTTGQTKRCLLP
jgi:hypothetical protein